MALLVPLFLQIKLSAGDIITATFLYLILIMLLWIATSLDSFRDEFQERDRL
jgi:hypothetical protein